MKILYITTISDTINGFLIPHIEQLVKDGHKVDVACNVVTEIDSKVTDLGCKIHQLSFQRSPTSIDNLKAYKELKHLIKREDYELVHTHTPIASFLTRMACRTNKGVCVVYTAHGFHFFKGANTLNWLLYFPAEFIASRYTDLLITINHEDYNRAKKFFSAKRIEYIPGIGIDLKRFKDVNVDKIKMRNSMNLKESDFIVVSAGEINDNKNHKTIIKAIEKLSDKNIKYLICGEGNLKDELNNLIDKLNLSEQVKLLGVRHDLPELFNICDVFAFPSKREGLGMASLEAMATGLPLVTSNIHGIVDYSLDEVTGFTCDPLDIECFSCSIKKLKQDDRLRNKIREHNKNAIDKFELSGVLNDMHGIYNYVIKEGNNDERQ